MMPIDRLGYPILRDSLCSRATVSDSSYILLKEPVMQRESDVVIIPDRRYIDG